MALSLLLWGPGGPDPDTDRSWRWWRTQDRPCHPRVPLPGALRPLPLAADRTGCPSPLPALGAAQLHSFHGFGLAGSFQNVQSLPCLPNPRPWLSAPKRAGTHPGPGRGPLSRLVASPLLTPGGQLGAWPHQLPPPGHGRGLWEQPVPPGVSPAPSEVGRLVEAPTLPCTPGQGSSATGSAVTV